MRVELGNKNGQDGDDEVRVKLDQGGEELTVPRDSIYQVITTQSPLMGCFTGWPCLIFYLIEGEIF